MKRVKVTVPRAVPLCPIRTLLSSPRNIESMINRSTCKMSSTDQQLGKSLFVLRHVIAVLLVL